MSGRILIIISEFNYTIISTFICFENSHNKKQKQKNKNSLYVCLHVERLPKHSEVG